MKLLYNNTDGKIFYAVPDKDLFWFTHSTNIPLAELDIDEVDPTNKAICLDLVRTCNKVDDAGLGKYYLSGGQVMQRDGWVERVMEIF